MDWEGGLVKHILCKRVFRRFVVDVVNGDFSVDGGDGVRRAAGFREMKVCVRQL